MEMIRKKLKQLAAYIPPKYPVVEHHAIAVREFPPLRNRKKQWPYLLMTLALLVPTIYFSLIASDVYVSESKFVVRTSEKNTVSLFGGVLDQIGIGESHSDSWIVHDFMLSRDVLQKLDQELNIKKAYSSKKIDFISRFPSIKFWDKSLEAFYDYFQSQVAVSLDPAASITTLTVKSFSPTLAWQINKKLLQLSEELINRLNERARNDMITVAQDEVSETTKKIYHLSAEISKLHHKKVIADPEGQGLQLQRLSLEKELANKELALALAALQKAKAQAAKQQLYIVRVSNPLKPDTAIEPRRLRAILSAFLLSFLVWSILSLLVSSVKEHHA
jgi:capsular polysaccharide transport system permease protein